MKKNNPQDPADRYTFGDGFEAVLGAGRDVAIAAVGRPDPQPSQGVDSSTLLYVALGLGAVAVIAAVAK